MRIEKLYFVTLAMTAVFSGPLLQSVLAQDKQEPPAKILMPGMESTVGFLSSGTSIEPDSTSESSPMIYELWRGWTVMFHANAFIEDTQQTGPRGTDKFFSTNWFMPMITRQSGRQSLAFRTMLSLEPATVTKRRYPELFQTGETAYGLPIVDGQHPHNLFMEITARYDRTINERTQIFVYGGPIGEPALGPTAYPHRASASEDPIAPLGHHEQDSTHISYSVITAGLSAGRFQLEGSTFHGQEPNENRWNIEMGVPDSFASRLTFSPTKDLSGQFSIGRINHREALDPQTDTLRTTASIEHHRTLSEGSWASSLIWGRNDDFRGADHRIFNSYALESTLNFVNRNWLWTRVENLDRDRTVLLGETPAARETEETPIGRVQAYSIGYERDLARTVQWLNLGIGFQYTTYGLTGQMKSLYGGRPQSFVMFMRLRPAGNMAAHMRMMHRH